MDDTTKPTPGTGDAGADPNADTVDGLTAQLDAERAKTAQLQDRLAKAEAAAADAKATADKAAAAAPPPAAAIAPPEPQAVPPHLAGVDASVNRNTDTPGARALAPLNHLGAIAGMASAALAAANTALPKLADGLDAILAGAETDVPAFLAEEVPAAQAALDQLVPAGKVRSFVDSIFGLSTTETAIVHNVETFVDTNLVAGIHFLRARLGSIKL